jgi:hypothetical protein
MISARCSRVIVHSRRADGIERPLRPASAAWSMTPLRIVIVALALTFLAPPLVRADGDPASDVLLGESVFYPYSPPVSPPVQQALNGQTAAARHAGFPIKVALIAAPTDLGVIPDLFGKPQKYADFLDQEISFNGKQPLLVVMAAGYGAQGMSAQARKALADLPKPAGSMSNDLAHAAIRAVAKLATAAGHPLRGQREPSGAGRGNNSRTLLLVTLVLAAVATATALLMLRRRQSTFR